MKLLKVLVPIIIAVSLLVGQAVPVSATEVSDSIVEEVTPQYEIACNPNSTLVINGETASCISSVSSKTTVSISATQTLQKQSGWFWTWDDVTDATWSGTANSKSIRISNTKNGLSSGTYRLKSVFTLTDSSGQTETITEYSNEVTI